MKEKETLFELALKFSKQDPLAFLHWAIQMKRNEKVEWPKKLADELGLKIYKGI